MAIPDNIAERIRQLSKDDAAFQQLIALFSDGAAHTPDSQTEPPDTELYYRAFFEQSNDAVFILDLAGNFLQVNQRAAEMFGYPLREISRFSYRDLVVQEQVEESESVIERLLAGRVVPPYERAFRHKDGGIIPAEINAQIIHDRDGNPLYFLSVVRDISERKQLEVANHAFLEDMKALQGIHLELSEVETLDTLYYRMIKLARQRLGIERIGLFRLDNDGNNLLGTYGVDKYGEIRKEEFYQETLKPGHWTYDILNAPNHAIMWEDEEIYDKRVAIGMGWKAASALWNGRRALGYIVYDNYITGRAARPYELELVSILGSTFGHLIERKETEDALRESEMLYRTVVTALTEGIVLQTRDGTVEACNPAAESILGLTAEQMTGRSSIDPRWRAIHEDGSDFPGETHPAMVTLRTGKSQTNVIMGVHKPDDTLTWISVNSQPIFRPNEDKPCAVLASFSDITEQKKARQHEFELALERERIGLLTSFIRDASHEFRTPLSTINSSVYFMTRSDDVQRRHEKVDQIHLAVQRINTLVDSLILMAKLEDDSALAFVPVDIRTLIPSICEYMFSVYGDKPALTYNDHPTLPNIMGNPTYLTDAIKNLLDNAYRFTPEDGTITLDIGAGDGVVLLEVRDTGIGISEDALPNIFETFWRLDEAHSTPGLGLGLSIADKIIERHGGQITVESEVGVGSTFRVELPTASVN